MEDYLSSITPNSRGYFHKPHYSDIRGWKKVCYGYQKKSPLENREDILYHGKDDALSDNIFVSKDETPTIYPEQSTLFSNINTKTTTNQPIKNEKQPRYPYEGYICDLAFLQTLDQKCITSLLAHFAMFLKTSINQRECEWLLGLMMAVTELMTSDELNGIRMLVKKCRTIREILVDKGDGVNKDENNEVGRSDGYIENRIDIESRNEIEAESGEEGEENESNCAQIGNTTTSLGLDVGIVGLNMVIAIGSIIFRQSDLGDVYPE